MNRNLVEHVARLNRQWLPMPEGLELPKSSAPEDIATDALVALELLAAAVLNPVTSDADKAAWLRRMADLADADEHEPEDAPAWLCGHVLREAASATLPKNWPQRPDGDLVQLGRGLSPSALEVVRKVARWWLGLPAGQPDDGMMVRVAAEQAQLMQDGLHVAKVSAAVVAEARQVAEATEARRRKRKATGSLDARAVAAVDLFEDRHGPDYRPNWSNNDVAELLCVHHSALARRQRDGAPACPEYQRRRAAAGRGPKRRRRPGM